MKPINVTVVGAGTMGHSLALAFIQHGHTVWLQDIRDEILSRARDLIASGLQTLVEMNLLESAHRDAAMSRLHTTTNLQQAAQDADLAIEAIVEDQSAKQALFTSLDQFCPPHTILASNTSYLDIFSFLKTTRPAKVIITHWFNPPHIIPLVEIVRGKETSEETAQWVKAVLLAMKKQPIVITKFLPGFIVNRLQSALRNEALYLLDNGYCTAEEIDIATRAGYGLRMPLTGVVQRMDFAGLDVTQKVLKSPTFQLAGQIRQSKTIDDQVANGRLGVKNGKGYYEYEGRSAGEIMKEFDVRLIRLIEFLKELE